MRKIAPNKLYSSISAAPLLGFKNRQRVIKYIQEGALRALVIENDGLDGEQRLAAKRYGIYGKWIISFNKRKKAGLIKDKKYTVAELKEVLRNTMEYCRENNIKTLKRLEESFKKIK